MEVLIDTPAHRVEVDCASNYEICPMCKGTGQHFATIYQNPYGFSAGGLAWLGIDLGCRGCRSQGFYKRHSGDKQP